MRAREWKGGRETRVVGSEEEKDREAGRQTERQINEYIFRFRYRCSHNTDIYIHRHVDIDRQRYIQKYR